MFNLNLKNKKKQDILHTLKYIHQLLGLLYSMSIEYVVSLVFLQVKVKHFDQ